MQCNIFYSLCVTIALYIIYDIKPYFNCSCRYWAFANINDYFIKKNWRFLWELFSSVYKLFLDFHLHQKMFSIVYSLVLIIGLCALQKSRWFCNWRITLNSVWKYKSRKCNFLEEWRNQTRFLFNFSISWIVL